MIKVELILQDATEIGAFADLMNEIDKYRAHKDHPRFANEPPAPGAATMAPVEKGTPEKDSADDDVVDAVYETEPAPGAPVIATIAPEGVVKAPSEAQMNAAAQAYLAKHGIEKALKLVAEFGVARVGELKDPAKMNELLARFVDGVK
jgi:hypothetical protein